MSAAPLRLGLVGLGEIGHGLALGLRDAGLVGTVAWQRDAGREHVRRRAAEAGVRLLESPQALGSEADLLIAVTQGSQAFEAARAIAPALRASQLYVDLSSASPDVKRAIEAALAERGTPFADGVLEGSTLEHAHRVPILASGAGASAFADRMGPWGMRIEVIGAHAGQASAVKLLRSVLMKGTIALLLECLAAARAAGVDAQVIASAAQWHDALPWRANALRIVRTTPVHAARRAEETDMARALLESLGVDPVMTRATVDVLGRVAALGLRDALGDRSPQTIEAAIDLMTPAVRRGGGADATGGGAAEGSEARGGSD